VLRPPGNESPSHKRQLSDGLFWMLAYDRHGLGGRDVVAGRPVWFFGTAVEVFPNKLVSPG
jgi:hypothetical protein